ncbi:MOSC domain-containing protein [Roseiterribacter gracilis]|uniref:Sulfurase n=1 Tax=Roseiterribacter gracilis TaxID=2812848 RepID=A0A8S8XC50_9PROT|nr:sulfurase [Rhodospirillales bacterium TMPK1]
MRVLNVSIGRVRTVQIAGEEVRTAYVKDPIAPPWTIGPDGVAGDERAVHPDKLYAFARTGYDYWRGELGGEGWADGFFGENLTLDQLDEEELRIGDVFAIGEQVQLEVVGARNPCLKLAWRLNQPRSFQRVFALSRHTGVYLGVLTPGAIEPHDVLRRVTHDPTMPSVADVADFIASHHPVPLQKLQRLLAFRRLSLTNRLLLSAKLHAAEQAADAVEDRWRGWRPFRIDRVVEEAPDIRSVYLRATDDAPLCQPRPGQFVNVRMPGVTRSWSLSAYAPVMNEYRLTVRRQTGAGSSWIHAATPGSTVELRAPTGNFALDTGCFRPVVLVAAGIGITPLLAMLQAHVARPRAPLIHLIYGARTPNDVAFRAELDAIAAAHENVRITYVYSRAGAAPSRITPDLVIETIAGLHVLLDGRRIDLPWFESDIYLCGPDRFCADLRDAFVARGANPDHLFSELFSAAATTASTVDVAEITFRRSGATATWRADEDLSLLELAESVGVQIDNECRAGTCLRCKSDLVAGGTTAELGDGTTLLCIARPAQASVVLDV